MSGGKARLTPVVDIPMLRDKEGLTNYGPRILDLWQQLASVLGGNVTSKHIRDGSVKRALLAAEVGLVKLAFGRYDGDGTGGRSVVTSFSDGSAFTPEEVTVVNLNTLVEFFSRSDGTGVASWYASAAGVKTATPVEWQGIVSNGFSLGSGVGSLSNIAGHVYSWRALRRG